MIAGQTRRVCPDGKPALAFSGSCSGCASLYTERRAKAGKIVRLRLFEGNNMGRTGKRRELPQKTDDKSKKTPPAPAEDDDFEDGDIATPKRDRDGDDDQPL
jgi:hypothetical protein